MHYLKQTQCFTLMSFLELLENWKAYRQDAKENESTSIIFAA